MTRIIAGAARGRSLVVPRGGATRPTADRVREALFSRLQHRGWLDGTRVLDLYAGTGALGLEAASRGAGHVLLVEQAADAVAACRRNAETLAAAGAATAQVRASSAGTALAGVPDAPYDLVLLDPPYDLGEVALAAVLARLASAWLAPDAVVVVERGSRSPEPCWPPGLELEDQRRYGEAVLWSARTPEVPG